MLSRHLNAIFGGDDAYHNFIAKNPYSEQWDVVGMRSTSYEMYELARISELEVKSTTFIERLQSKQTDKALKQASDRATVKTGERNDFLFNTVRVRAYSLYNKHSKNWTRQQFENCLNDFANELNETKCSPPVQVSEVATICHSITNYCYGSFGEKQRMTKSEISEIAAKCGKKSVMILLKPLIIVYRILFMTLERMNVLLNEKIMNLQVKISDEANDKTLNYKIYQQQLKDAQCLKKDINEDFDYDS